MPVGDGHFRRSRGFRARRRRRSLILPAFWAALGFLTLFPTLGSRNPTQQHISNARAWYPLVGLLLGLLLAGVARVSELIFPAALTAALLVAALVAATRGLHLDGLMDVCDGLFGGYTPERRLEIMRDSHVGAFAVLGAVSLLLLKYGALVSLLSLELSGEVSGMEWSLVFFPALGRWAMVLQLGAFSYVRSRGLGSPLHQGGAKLPTAVAAVTAGAVAVVAGGIGGLVLLAGVSLLAWLLGAGITRMIGGLTGDAYGATNEIVEVVTLIAAVALLPLGVLEPLPSLLGWF